MVFIDIDYFLIEKEGIGVQTLGIGLLYVIGVH